MKVLYKTKPDINGNIYRLYINYDEKTYTDYYNGIKVIEIQVTRKTLRELEKELIEHNYTELY